MDVRPLKGQHHVSSITSDASSNYNFYTKVLGMRLVKKSVNQDDTSMYHLFYADERGNPGTDLTFFEIPRAGDTYYGTNSITATSLRVPKDDSLLFWKNRFKEFGVEHEDISHASGRANLFFKDFEGQRLVLVSDEHNLGVESGQPWNGSSIPIEYAIRGLGPIELTISNLKLTSDLLTNVLGFRRKGTYNSKGHIYTIFETGEGGTGAELHLVERSDLPKERPGRGSVHHVAFRVEDEEQLEKWVKHLKELRIPNSGLVERYYFKSLYFREPNGILFELATDGPGFEGDESFEHLGERLSLPPFFEKERESIEAKLKPLNTVE